MTEGLSRAGFDLDLADGQFAEGKLATILQTAGRLIECKSDKKARRTGNLFVEFRQYGRPSGLQTTQAHWWAFEIDDDLWLVVEHQRLHAAAERAYREKGPVRGGDFNEFEGVLIPLDWLVHRFREAA